MKNIDVMEHYHLTDILFGIAVASMAICSMGWVTYVGQYPASIERQIAGLAQRFQTVL